jgi:hypothetical protein
MTIRILGLLAAIATLATVSTPSFAAEDEIAAPSTDEAVATSPVPPPRCEPWMRDCRRPEPRPPMRYYRCFARNILGRTFVAVGGGRTPLYFVQSRALQNCRMQSFPLIRNTCRAASLG